jgi:glutamate-ammonia-ligase adenylyltransferase
MVDKEKPPRDIWDVKLIPGGLVDIEFLAQYFALIAPLSGLGHVARDPGTEATLARLGPSVLEPADLDAVIQALRLYSAFAQMARLCVEGDFIIADAPDGLKDLICQIAEAPDIRVLEAEIRRMSAQVRKIFRAAVRAAV